jgi:hypothetical protein
MRRIRATSHEANFVRPRRFFLLSISGDYGPMDLRHIMAESSSDEPIPAGLYLARIYELEWGETGEKSKDPGKPKLTVTFKVDGGDYDGHEIDRFYTFGKASGFFKQMVRAATDEISNDQLAGRATMTAVDLDKALTGARVVIEAKVEEFRGQPRNDIPNVFSATSEMAKRAKNYDVGDDRMPD